jgi:protein TonB
VAVYTDRPAAQRLVSLGGVAALHVGLIVLLLSSSPGVQVGVPLVLRAVRIVIPPRPPPPPPRLTPVLRMPDLAALPAPDILLVTPKVPAAPPAVVQVARRAPSVSHFGPATDDAGLGVDAAVSGGGGARGRGSLADFQASVRRAVLARRVQPRLAWDRRNTCVINYTVTVARDGSLAGMSIDACAVPEINAAAAAAIRAAAPFAAPPDLGAARTDVHGSLIFRP